MAWPGFPPDHVALSPADRVRQFLLDDSSLSNREVSFMARASVAQVERVRRSMIDLGLLMPRRVVATHFRGLKELPRSPRVLQEGACVGHPRADAWTSDDWHERQQAVEVCRLCHVIDACREWSLTLPAKDRAIYAGLTSAGRDALRRQRAGIPDPLWVTRSNANAPRAERRARQRAREQQKDAEREAAGGAA